MDGTWLLVVPIKTEVRIQLLQTRCVVIQLAMNRSRRVSVVLTLMAVLMQRCSVLERSFCFGKFLVGCGSSAIWQRPAVCFTPDFNIHYLFKYSVKIKLTRRHWHKWMTKDERLNPQMQTSYSGPKTPEVGHSTNSNKLSILYWSVLDIEPCQPVLAVGQ